MAQFLLTREADCDATDRYGNSALHYAASSDNGILVKWLIEQTEDWEAKINAINKVRLINPLPVTIIDG